MPHVILFVSIALAALLSKWLYVSTLIHQYIHENRKSIALSISDSNAMHFYNILTVGQFSRKLSHLVKLHIIYIHVAGVIYSIMVKMAAPVTEHCSKAPRTRKIYVIEKQMA